MVNQLAGNLVFFGALSTWLKPLWLVAVGAGAAMAALLLIAALLRLLVPKVAAIAQITTKEGLWQPLFYVLLAFGVFLLLLFPFIPYVTFGEDVNMVKTEGLTLIKLLAIVLALWTASVSIADEIEGRTALTLLSKPIGRREFILGKFLGIIGPVALLFIVLGVVFLASVSYKVVYDAREMSQPEPSWQACRNEMLQIVPGLVLAFLEAVVLTSISVAISTRLAMLSNLIICASIYVLGHLVPLLLNSPVRQFEIVGFVARLFATVLPVLDHFNIETAVATGQWVPGSYLAWATGYCVLYSSVALLVALLLFEDRDLA